MLHRISVIITAHHRRNYLLKSVKSVIDQNFSRDDVEIIVVKNFHDRDIDFFLNENNVKSIYTENESPGSKIAVGIQNCNGELLTFLDDDDEYAPERLKVASAEFETNPGLIYYHNSMSFVDDSGKPVTPLRLLNKTRVEINKQPGKLQGIKPQCRLQLFKHYDSQIQSFSLPIANASGGPACCGHNNISDVCGLESAHAA